MCHYLFLCITMTIACRGFAQDIVFPNHEESPQLSGNNPEITERIPIYIPTRCAENMLLYPGQGEKSSWVCDCKPKFLYFPLNHSCHEAYRQGPCLPGNYVHLPSGEVVPRCVENPCLTDGLVPFNGQCYALESNGPCGRAGVLRVNASTFQIECTPLNSLLSIAEAPKTRVNQPCPVGSRATPSGGCRNPL